MIELAFASSMEKIALAPGVNSVLEAMTGAMVGGAGGLALVRGQKTKGQKSGDEELAGAGLGAAAGAGTALLASAVIRNRMVKDMLSKLVKSQEFQVSERTMALADQAVEVRAPIIERQLQLADTDALYNRFYSASVTRQGMTPSAVARWRTSLPRKERDIMSIIAGSERNADILGRRLGEVESKIGGRGSRIASRLRQEIAQEKRVQDTFNKGLGRTQAFIRTARDVHSEAVREAERKVRDIKARAPAELKALRDAQEAATTSHQALIEQFQRRAKDDAAKKYFGVL